MRLVGATNWRIRMPFLIEGLVESLVGAIAAIAVPVRDQGLRHRSAPWHRAGSSRWVRNVDVLTVIPWILIAAVAVAVIAGTIGMRRFLDV